MIPELSESYTVKLSSADADDIYPSTDSFSGASVNAQLAQRTINVSQNDDPNGVAQFAESAPVGDDTIPPAIGVLQIDVEETAGQVSVFVVRAQGVFGGGLVDYASADGTAVAGEDYEAVSGTLEFGDGERVKSFSVELIDNQEPELDKHFFLNLTIPTDQGEHKNHSCN